MTAKGLVVPTLNPMQEPFLAAADAAARDRPGVDRDLARELMAEAATLLHNGLALDGLDEHDATAAIALLSRDLVAPDPSAAVSARTDSVLNEPGKFHDPQGVSAAIRYAAGILQL
jgi:hypothetical protein